MQWNKAKTVLIVVLLLVNVFLFSVTQQTVRSRSLLEDEYIDNAISLLQTRGLSIAKEVFPSQKLHLSTVSVSTREMLYPLARTLLGDETMEPSVEGDGIWFRGQNGSVLLSGAADFVFEPVEPLRDLAQGKELLLRAGFLEEELMELDGKLVQTLYGVPLHDCVVKLEQGGLTGRLLVTGKGTQRNDELIDVANALLCFAASLDEPGLAWHTVTGVTPAYRVETGGLFNVATCTPAYRIETKAGACLVSATTGEVLNVS